MVTVKFKEVAYIDSYIPRHMWASNVLLMHIISKKKISRLNIIAFYCSTPLKVNNIISTSVFGSGTFCFFSGIHCEYEFSMKILWLSIKRHSSVPKFDLLLIELIQHCLKHKSFAWKPRVTYVSWMFILSVAQIVNSSLYDIYGAFASHYLEMITIGSLFRHSDSVKLTYDQPDK